MRQRLAVHLAACSLLLIPFTACDRTTMNGGHSVSTTPADVASGAEASRAQRLRTVNDWAYQLQGDEQLDLTPIATSAFDLVVMDYSADGRQEGEFTAEQIADLRRGADGPKIVLAYMSIGEAEIGRFYFDKSWITPDPDANPEGPFTLTDAAPAFLASPNPDFPDNFKVRFDDPVWQQIIIANPGGHPIIQDAPSYLDRIIDAGFDGVYLDIVDAFEFFGPAEIGGNGEKPEAASLMVDFVIAIANHARVVRGKTGFLVFPQNGSGLIQPDAYPPDTVPPGLTGDAFAAQRTRDYFAAIDGIGAEDTFYTGDADNDNPLDPQQTTIEELDRFTQAGKGVLAIDYLTRSSTIDDFYARARMHGWVPYASVRSLSVLTINPTQPPD